MDSGILGLFLSDKLSKRTQSRQFLPFYYFFVGRGEGAGVMAQVEAGELEGQARFRLHRPVAPALGVLKGEVSSSIQVLAKQ